ncbi:unnamed protein product [Rotaria sordida]|uniref:Uncharacterized protein n=1 Tax=Rotaria sordida TaxID=392033 RepID=A0A819GEJ3_9BILA|nr:unnamed protein product [Rotaria sordida]CAF3855973.1 unnamed protein product [Rotaria sordida]CAF3884103.1 unnamed protein product [Rotaria sordida]
MSSSTGITQHVSSIVKLNRFLILTVTLIVCCSCIYSKPIDLDQLQEYEVINSHHPIILSRSEWDLVQRAAPRLGRASPRLGRASPRLGRASPRLGRASPRLGRASPRLGRHVVDLMSRLNHLGQYYNVDDDYISNDDPYEIEYLTHEQRAAPRLGRAIKLDQHR